MEKKSGLIDGKKVDIINITHNRTVFSMIHAINSFDDETKHYSGKKILVFDSISNLNSQTPDLKKLFLSYINHSSADILVGYSKEMRSVIRDVAIPALWFPARKGYLEEIQEQITEDSLIFFVQSDSTWECDFIHFSIH